MRISDHYTFDEYYVLVEQNVSKRLLTKELKQTTKEPLLEVIHDMYNKDVLPTTAVKLIESFYSNFRNFLNTNIPEENDL